MAARSAARAAAVIVTAAALIGSAAWLQRVRESRYPSREVSDETLYINSGGAVRILTAGYHALAADLYWIRTIQYYGGIKLGMNERAAGTPAPSQYSLLYPLLDLTTSLDPYFNIAYRFGAIFLADSFPSGAGRPDLAIALLEKGLAARPDKWEYMQDIGFVHYWWTHDFQAAARWFDRAGQVPGAPWFLRSMAASTLAQGGDRASSRLMWESIRQSAEIDWLRDDAERRLMQLKALDDLDALQPLVDRLTKRDGTPPAEWTPLVRDGLIPGVPLDPTKTPYVIEASGRVSLSAGSRLLPLPEEPQRFATPSR